MTTKNKAQYIVEELGHHLPFTVFGVILALIMMGVLQFFAILLGREDMMPTASEELFHLFHPAHILISAVVTTAMFYKHEKTIVKAAVVGFLGSVGICALSDIFFPYLGASLMGTHMHLHICVLEEPGLVLPFALTGVVAGLLIGQSIERSTEYSHSAHLFTSSVASLLYLIGYGVTDWIHALGSVFVITLVAVVVPCCLSDIVFPLVCVHRNCHHKTIPS